ncbi:MAG: iron ABC transporter permease [Acidimicrobiales bacterium]|nr:iron ABC transporter permease [Acidimicrobiales bacterium]
MSGSREQTQSPAFLKIGVLGIAFLFSFPAGYLLWRNFTGDTSSLTLLNESPVLSPLQRSLVLAVSVSLTTAVLGILFAWLTSRCDLPGKRFWKIILPIPLVFPSFIGAAAFIRTMNPGGFLNSILSGIGIDNVVEIRGFFGAWFVLTLFCYPYVYLPVAAKLRHLPSSLEETSRVLNRSPFKTFQYVVYPQISSVLYTGTLLVFLYTISDFGAVQLLRYDTLTRSIATAQLANKSLSLALGLFLLVIAGIIVFAERMVSKSSPAPEQSEIGPPLEYNLGFWKIPSFLLVSLITLLSLGAPLFTLGKWAFDGIRRGSGSGQPLTIDGEQIWESTWNTLSISVIAGIAAIIAVLPIAILIARFKSKVGGLAHFLVIATFAVPGILIALSMRFWSLQTDWAYNLFNNTKALLVFSYVVRFGSLAMGVVLLSVAAVPRNLEDAGQTLGVNRISRFFRVNLPLMAPGLGAAAGLVILSTMKELPITLLISPLGFSTLATRMFSSFEEAFIAEAGILAVILVGLSSLLTWTLVIRKSEHL